MRSCSNSGIRGTKTKGTIKERFALVSARLAKSAKAGLARCRQRCGDSVQCWWKTTGHRSLNEVYACPTVQKLHVWVNVPNQMIAWVRKQACVRVLPPCECGGRGSSEGGGGGVFRERSRADTSDRVLQSRFPATDNTLKNS